MPFHWHGCIGIRVASNKSYTAFKGHFVADKTANLEAMMRLALAGDKLAYTTVLRETSRFLRPFLSKRVNQPAEIDDLLQEILLSIHKARHTYDGERPYKPWAFAIAKFRLLDHLRAHYADHLRHSVELSEVENILPEHVTESGITYESISGEVHKLPGKQAAIVQMMHQEGYTAREVAEILNMKESAVKVAAHRAYKVIRNALVGK